MGRPHRIRTVTGGTRVRVEERGKIVIKKVEDCLPPAKWMAEKRREIKPDAENVDAVIGNIWWGLSARKKLEIMERTKKFRGFA